MLLCSDISMYVQRCIFKMDPGAKSDMRDV